MINASIVYASVAIKNVASKAENVTTRNIANINAATANGHFKTFCNIADTIITAIGNAKNINNVFILITSICIFYIICYFLYFCELNLIIQITFFYLLFLHFMIKYFLKYGGNFVWNLRNVHVVVVFFMSNNDVCCNCESKDMFDIAKLNSIMEDNINFNSIQELSNESGITINNLSRYIKNNKIDYKF